MNKKRLLTVMGGNSERKLNITGSSFVSDTILYKSIPAVNYSSADNLRVRSSATVQRNVVIKFDLSGIPSGVTITKALLYLYIQELPTLTDAVVNVYPILAANSDMVISEMTWNVRKTGTAWAGDSGGDGGDDGGCMVAGTDYSSTPIATFTTPYTANLNDEQEIELDLTTFSALVANNYGLVIITERTVTHAWHSTEAETEAYRPKLVVTYTKS